MDTAGKQEMAFWAGQMPRMGQRFWTETLFDGYGILNGNCFGDFVIFAWAEATGRPGTMGSENGQ